jgi:hypothetical protein
MNIHENKSTNIELENIDVLMTQYLETLNEKEKKAYSIAKSHLGSSFQLEKSNTFLQWKKEINAASYNLGSS